MNKIKKISALLLGTAFILSSTVFASTGTVTTDGLRMRKEASTDGEIVTSLNNGAQVEIVEKVGDWYKVKYYDEYEGYLFSEYVKINGEEQEETETPEQTPEAEEPVETKPEENIAEEQPDQEEPVQNNEEKAPETIESNTYPMETTVKVNAKIYMLPLITSSHISEINEDTKVTVQKELNDWVYISSEEITGWARKYNINITSGETINTEPTEEKTEEQTTVEEKPDTQKPEEDKPEEVISEQQADISKGYINVSAARIREKPSTDAEILEVLSLNTEVKITAETDEWYKIQFNSITGYISKTLISEELTQTSRGNAVRQPEVQENLEVAPLGDPQTTEEKTSVTEENKPEVQETENKVEQTITITSEGQKVADFAKQYVGYKYVYGGTTPSTGFDCSGFVYYVYNSCGHSISRSCSAQAKSGRAISKANLEIGDLVFFNNTSDGTIGHVGIYIGNGEFVHAATSKKGVRIDTINSGYYNTYYYSARRVL